MYAPARGSSNFRLSSSGRLRVSLLSGFWYVAKSAADEDPEVIKVIESLVVDNVMPKADNNELYKILTGSREGLQALEREGGEQSIAPRLRGKFSAHTL